MPDLKTLCATGTTTPVSEFKAGPWRSGFDLPCLSGMPFTTQVSQLTILAHADVGTTGETGNYVKEVFKTLNKPASK